LPDEVTEGWRELPSSREDWLTEDEWVAWLSLVEPEEWAAPGEDPDEDPGPDDPARPGAGQAQSSGAAKRARAAQGSVRAAKGGRRGPGQPGSACRIPDASPGPAGAFGTGHPLDAAPGGAALHGLAEYAAGTDDRFPGTTDDELTGIICALDRAEAAASALKHAAVAELIRRRPDPAREPVLAAPRDWDEFTSTELSHALADTRWAADGMLDLAQTLTTKLPGTYAAFRTGVLRESKAAIIARAVAVLDPDEARAAEALVLDRAGRLTPGGLRAAIARAVIEVAPGKAAKRREKGTQDARVQRWMEDSGNAALMGRELPPADVLAADQRITWWAKQLKKAGLDGDMDQLRARAYLDILLGRDSRPAARPDPQGGTSPHLPPAAGVIPAGFAGRINLTIPLATLLDLAERPGEIAGLGPIDPALARDLANAAAASPQTTWCVTVTDEQGHATGHGCARPGPRTRTRTRPAQHPGPRPPGGPDPPGGTPSQGFTFTATGQPGPPGGYGHWRLATGIPGRPDLMIALDPIVLGECDHRFQARGHDPGARLRHLSQIRHATCTGPTCRRPSTQADFEHNIPYEAGGRTCLCNGGPKCRHEHRLKQHPGWNVEQITPGTQAIHRSRLPGRHTSAGQQAIAQGEKPQDPMGGRGPAARGGSIAPPHGTQTGEWVLAFPMFLSGEPESQPLPDPFPG
jgi:hypothetical protein